MSKNNSNQQCYDCRKVNCPCSIGASGRTYKKVNRALSNKLRVPCPNTGYPSQDFVLLLDRLQRI